MQDDAHFLKKLMNRKEERKGCDVSYSGAGLHFLHFFIFFFVFYRSVDSCDPWIVWPGHVEQFLIAHNLEWHLWFLVIELGVQQKAQSHMLFSDTATELKLQQWCCLHIHFRGGRSCYIKSLAFCMRVSPVWTTSLLLWEL